MNFFIIKLKARSSINTSTLYVANFLTFKKCFYDTNKLNEIYSNNSTYLNEIYAKLNANKCHLDIETKVNYYFIINEIHRF